MDDPVSVVTTFFVDNFPSWKAMAVGGPIGLLWSYLCLYLSGWLKRHKSVRTGYSRKIFHFLIFASVALIHAIWGTPMVCLVGGMASLVILYALWRGSGNLLYEAMAREKDSPHRTYFIVSPYFATLIGGLASNMLFGHAALVGYLVTGVGDAIGEPVGTRFGKHTYRVPSFKGVKSIRSHEGSAAVCIASAVAIATAVILSPRLHWSAGSLFLIPVLAGACMLVEALSPHGWDNATMQIVPSFLAATVL